MTTAGRNPSDEFRGEMGAKAFIDSPCCGGNASSGQTEEVLLSTTRVLPSGPVMYSVPLPTFVRYWSVTDGFTESRSRPEPTAERPKFPMKRTPSAPLDELAVCGSGAGGGGGGG